MNRINTLCMTLTLCLGTSIAIADNAATNGSDNFKPIANIQGNPVGKKNNYTLNSDKMSEQSVECIFINSGDKPAKLNIWTDPKAEQPNQDIHLSAGNAAKPFQLMKHLLLTLKSHWWCHTALPTQTNNQWPFCSYLSISDQEVTDKNPFRPWDKTIHSKSISYNCRLKKPHKKLSFFYYK